MSREMTDVFANGEKVPLPGARFICELIANQFAWWIHVPVETVRY